MEADNVSTDKHFKIFDKNVQKEGNYFRANFKAESSKEEKLKIFLNKMKKLREDRKEQSNYSIPNDEETYETGGIVSKRSKSRGRDEGSMKYEGSPTRSKSVGRDMLSKSEKNQRSKSNGRERFNEYSENKGECSSFTTILKKERNSKYDKICTGQERVGRSKSQERNNIPVISWRSRSRDRRSKVSSSLDRFPKKPREMANKHCIDREIPCKHYGKREIPCKHYNHRGYCLYDSGHLNLEGFAKIHVCGKCFFGEGGSRRSHPEIDCPRRNHPEIDYTRRERREEPCNFFNNVGNCDYQSGHTSKCGLYSQVHICRFCLLEFDKKLFHSALHCWYKNNWVEKPCTYFNNTGNCRLQSGHFNQSGFVKQLHICRCCLEFNNKIQYHPAIDCRLKEALEDGRGEEALVDRRKETEEALVDRRKETEEALVDRRKETGYTDYDEKASRAREQPSRHSHHNMARQSGPRDGSDVQMVHRGRSDVRTIQRGRSDGLQKLQVSGCCFDYREEKNEEAKSSPSKTRMLKDVQQEKRKDGLAFGRKDQDEIKRNGSPIDIRRKHKSVKSRDNTDVEKTENKSKVNRTHNSTQQKYRDIAQKIRDLNSEEDNDADDESDQVDLSIHMNPVERFPDEGDIKVVKHSTPSKLKKTSSTLLDHIVRVTKEKIENIEGKIKVLENREKLKYDVNKKITQASIGGDKQYGMPDVPTQPATVDGSGAIRGSISTVNDGGTDNSQPADHLPRDLPNQTGEKDSVLEQEEIMLKIELLEKLHVSWSKKLREARQQGEPAQPNRHVDREARQQGGRAQPNRHVDREAWLQGERAQPNRHVDHVDGVEHPPQEIDP